MRDRITVYVLLCIATILRFDFLVASDFRIDSDEAIVGLMARHALEQGVLPVFYYGQHYMGSFEPLMAALSFSWLGAGVFALKIVPLLFSILFLFLVYRLGTEIASPAVGKVALLLGAIPPATLVIWSTKARGGFIELLCIGTAAFLATVHWCKKPDERRVYTAFAGLLLGFGWWVSQLNGHENQSTERSQREDHEADDHGRRDDLEHHPDGGVAGAPLQVSGPAAGLTVLVYEIIQNFGI